MFRSYKNGFFICLILNQMLNVCLIVIKKSQNKSKQYHQTTYITSHFHQFYFLSNKTRLSSLLSSTVILTLGCILLFKQIYFLTDSFDLDVVLLVLTGHLDVNVLQFWLAYVNGLYQLLPFVESQSVPELVCCSKCYMQRPNLLVELDTDFVLLCWLYYLWF